MNKNFIIFPAIDIMDGKVVRLEQGQFNRVINYSKDPLAVAKEWESQGAQWIHVVDLDGAKTGRMVNAGIIKKIAKEVSVPIQVGGGVRSEETLKELMDANIKRVVIGTKAIHDDQFMNIALGGYLDYIAVSIDCAQGLLTDRGWVEMTKIKGTDLAKKLESKGLKHIIYTDIQRDGTLTGPNFDRIEEILKAVKMNVIASGGISDLEDIYYLYELIEKYPHLVGAITGRAIYEDRLDFKKALTMPENFNFYKAIYGGNDKS